MPHPISISLRQMATMHPAALAVVTVARKTDGFKKAGLLGKSPAVGSGLANALADADLTPPKSTTGTGAAHVDMLASWIWMADVMDLAEQVDRHYDVSLAPKTAGLSRLLADAPLRKALLQWRGAASTK